MSNAEPEGTLGALNVIQYSDGMYIVANQAVCILRRDIRKYLNLPEVPLDRPVEHMEMLLIFAVCHRTYNGGSANRLTRLRRCISDMEYMKRRAEEGLPDYVIRALQIGIDPTALHGLAETYSLATELAAQEVPQEPDSLHRYRLQA